MPIYIEIVSISNCFQFISIRSYTTRKYFIVSSNCIVPLPLPSNLIIWDECPCKVKGGPSFVVSGGMMSFPVWSHVPSKGSGQWWMVAEPWGGGVLRLWAVKMPVLSIMGKLERESWKCEICHCFTICYSPGRELFICLLFMFTDYPSQCATIGYGQPWERVEGGDTTNSILRKLFFFPNLQWRIQHSPLEGSWIVYHGCPWEVHTEFLFTARLKQSHSLSW